MAPLSGFRPNNKTYVCARMCLYSCRYMCSLTFMFNLRTLFCFPPQHSLGHKLRKTACLCACPKGRMGQFFFATHIEYQNTKLSAGQSLDLKLLALGGPFRDINKGGSVFAWKECTSFQGIRENSPQTVKVLWLPPRLIRSSAVFFVSTLKIILISLDLFLAATFLLSFKATRKTNTARSCPFSPLLWERVPLLK